MSPQRSIPSNTAQRLARMSVSTGPSCHVFCAYPPESPAAEFPANLDEPPLSQSPKPTRSHSKKKPEGYIPRPPNSWILFRSMSTHAHKIKEDLGAAATQLRIVSRLKYVWETLPEPEKLFWKMKAEHEKAKHKEKYPNYKYNPKKRGRNNKQDQEQPASTSPLERMIDSLSQNPKFSNASMELPCSNFFNPAFTANSVLVYQMQSTYPQGLLSPPLSASSSPSPSEESTSSSEMDSNQYMWSEQMNSNVLPPGAPLLRSTVLPNISYEPQIAHPHYNNGLYTPPPSASFDNNKALPVYSDAALLSTFAGLELTDAYAAVGDNYQDANAYSSNSLGLINHNPNMQYAMEYQCSAPFDAYGINNGNTSAYVPPFNYGEPVHTVAGQNMQMWAQQDTNVYDTAPYVDETFEEMLRVAREIGLVIGNQSSSAAPMPIIPQSTGDDQSWLEFLNMSASDDSLLSMAAQPGFPGQHF